mmetsp:Transcript_5653/g.6939  ORF Transcript_5653/g.6939 Transcript_5653/m.6939 type:complete len:178 (+) Transcript_5653:66-599(+)
MCVNTSNLTGPGLCYTNTKSILRIKSFAESINSIPSNSSLSSSRSVQFDKVEIREYSITLGDNPSCSSGPPISLGWNYSDEEQSIPLEQYEQYRDGTRRVYHEMKVPSSLRHHILKEWNIPTREIITAQCECQVVQQQRNRTAQKYQNNCRLKTFTSRIKKGARIIVCISKKNRRTQ